MGLTAANYADQLQALLPPGKAYDFEADSILAGLLLGMADELARVDAAGLALIEESDPRSTSALFSEWENDYGLPDLCSGEVPDLAARRGLLLEKINRLGAQMPEYFVQLAALLGYTITVTELKPFTVRSAVNDPLYPQSVRYVWRVTSELHTVHRWTVRSPVTDPLSSWGNEILECVINRAKPAHTHVQFSYIYES